MYRALEVESIRGSFQQQYIIKKGIIPIQYLKTHIIKILLKNNKTK